MGHAATERSRSVVVTGVLDQMRALSSESRARSKRSSARRAEETKVTNAQRLDDLLKDFPRMRIDGRRIADRLGRVDGEDEARRQAHRRRDAPERETNEHRVGLSSGLVELGDPLPPRQDRACRLIRLDCRPRRDVLHARLDRFGIGRERIPDGPERSVESLVRCADLSASSSRTESTGFNTSKMMDTSSASRKTCTVSRRRVARTHLLMVRDLAQVARRSQSAVAQVSWRVHVADTTAAAATWPNAPRVDGARRQRRGDSAPVKLSHRAHGRARCRRR